MKGNRLWIVGTAAVIVGVVVLGWLVGISPKLAEGDLATSQRVGVEQQNTAQELRLQLLREQFDNLDELQADLAALRKEIPASQAVDDFIDSLQVAATASGVVIIDVQASEASAYGVTADEEAPAEAATVVEGVFALHVQIEVLGTPESVVQFGRLIQLGTRTFTMGSFGYATTNGILDGYIYIVPATATATVVEDEPTASPPDPAPTTEPTAEPTADPTPEATEEPTD